MIYFLSYMDTHKIFWNTPLYKLTKYLNLMNKKVVLTFYNQDGDVVKELSKDPANMNDIMAAIQFLENAFEISIACREIGSSSSDNV